MQNISGHTTPQLYDLWRAKKANNGTAERRTDTTISKKQSEGRKELGEGLYVSDKYSNMEKEGAIKDTLATSPSKSLYEISGSIIKK